MRRSRIVGATLGVALVAGACATSTGTTSGSRFGVSPSAPPTSRTLSSTERDSLFAQAVADREGPRVSIYAEFDNVVGSRRLRANFHVDDDAYVVVGHLDADGVLRIAFPTEPGDDGFVRGQHSYQTAQFFAGFTDQYRYRATTGFFRTTQSAYDSYDGGTGYVFIIASWRPMHFEQFATSGSWDSFEVADADYMRDPRPAIYELASLLAGENREAYTVKFARYTDTQSLYSGYGNRSSAFGYGYCAGYEPLGFASSPFENRYAFSPLYGYGSSFSYRGSRYFYDAAQDCYRSAPSYYGQTYGIAFGSPINTPPSRPRPFNLNGPRQPRSPRVPPGHVMPLDAGQSSGAITNGDQTIPAASPHYRQRGLITADAPSTGPVGRTPRGQTRPIDDGARPSIQEMTNRRGDNAHDGSGWSRAQLGNDAGTMRQGSSTSSPSPHRERAEPTSSGESRGSSRPTPGDNPRSAPAARSEPRSEPAPRMEAPARTSPPPAPAQAPRSEPPASSGSKPPGKGSSI
jgi:hypothetical protein